MSQVCNLGFTWAEGLAADLVSCKWPEPPFAASIRHTVAFSSCCRLQVPHSYIWFLPGIVAGGLHFSERLRHSFGDNTPGLLVLEPRTWAPCWLPLVTAW